MRPLKMKLEKKYLVAWKHAHDIYFRLKDIANTYHKKKCSQFVCIHGRKHTFMHIHINTQTHRHTQYLLCQTGIIREGNNSVTISRK